MRRTRWAAVVVLLAFLFGWQAGCALNQRRPVDLAERFECLEQKHVAVVAAHRGQADQTAAENAMSSFRASHAAGVPFLEIDVGTTKDGVLALMHDDTLDRTTTGHGRVDSHTWAEIQAVEIKRPDGTRLPDHPPSLTEVLTWGHAANAFFELDVKRTTRFSDVVDVVHATHMTDHVIVVTYTLDDAVSVHKLDPWLVISVTFDKPEAVPAAAKALDPHRILGWIGTSEPQPAMLKALLGAGIEPILGTLGRPGQRLDDIYLADGNGSEYVDHLVHAGVVLIASDAAVAAQHAIGNGYRACFP